MNSTIRLFSIIAFLEGISYVLLLFIAMPLKYLLHWPVAVQLVGWGHGILFIAYVFSLLFCWISNRWSFLRVVGYFIASLLPLVPFYVERSLKKEYQLQEKM
jgi:integral membrane protein